MIVLNEDLIDDFINRQSGQCVMGGYLIEKFNRNKRLFRLKKLMKSCFEIYFDCAIRIINKMN
jgi:hypothetical protein